MDDDPLFRATNRDTQVLVSGDVALLLNRGHDPTGKKRARRRGIDPAQLTELRKHAQRFMDALAAALGERTEMLGTHFPSDWPDSRDFDAGAMEGRP